MAVRYANFVSERIKQNSPVVRKNAVVSLKLRVPVDKNHPYRNRQHGTGTRWRSADRITKIDNGDEDVRSDGNGQRGYVILPLAFWPDGTYQAHSEYLSPKFSAEIQRLRVHLPPTHFPSKFMHFGSLVAGSLSCFPEPAVIILLSGLSEGAMIRVKVEYANLPCIQEAYIRKIYCDFRNVFILSFFLHQLWSKAIYVTWLEASSF